MQRVVLKDITCLSDAPFGNESEHQTREYVKKCIRQFNKETLKNERQARKEGRELMMLFVSKKRMLSYHHYELYSFREDDNVLQFPYQGIGWMDFLVEITTEDMQ